MIGQFTVENVGLSNTALYHAPCLSALWNEIDPRVGLGSSHSFLLDLRASIFLHHLKTPKGKKRLVCVEYVYYEILMGSFYGTPPERPDSLALRASVLIESSTSPNPSWEPLICIPEDIHRVYAFPNSRQTNALNYALPDSRQANACLTFYAAQMDPTDPSRFSIRCRRGSEEAFIDGWLDDGPSAPVLHMDFREDASAVPYPVPRFPRTR